MGVGGSRLLRSGNAPLRSITSSDMVRTKETLSGFLRGYGGASSDELEADRSFPLDSAHAPLVSFDPRLRERAKGAQEGRLNNMSLAEAEELDRLEGVPAKFHETDSVLQARLAMFVNELVNRHTEDGEPVASEHLVVAHGGCIRVFLRDIFKVNGGLEVKVWNSSVTTVHLAVTRIDGKCVWRVELGEGGIGDTSYIPPALVTTRSDW